jgi:hypothetical protein
MGEKKKLFRENVEKNKRKGGQRKRWGIVVGGWELAVASLVRCDSKRW